MGYELTTGEGFSQEDRFRQFRIGIYIEWDFHKLSLHERSAIIREMDDWMFAMAGMPAYVPPAHVYAAAYTNENSWAKSHEPVNWSTYAFMNRQHAIAFKLRFG